MRGRLLILVGLIILLVVIVVVVFSSGILNTGTPAVDTTQTAGNGSTQVATVAPLLPTPTPIQMVTIVQSLQNLPRGYIFPTTIEELTQKGVAGYVDWPLDAAPINAITKENGGLESLLGKVARTEIFREQPILGNLLVANLTELAKVGSDAAAVLPPGRVAVSFPIDRITSVAYAVSDGDHVDIIISMLFVDVDLAFQTLVPNTITLFSTDGGKLTLLDTLPGRPDQTAFGPAIIGPSEQQRPRLVTQRTIQDAIVIHVGDFPLDGHFIGLTPTPASQEPQPTAEGGGSGGGGTPTPLPTPLPRPDIITLAVSPQYAVVLAWAIEAKLPVTLALRSVNDTSQVSTLPVTLDYMMSEFNIDVPARRDFTIEPAIRSIRQLLAGQEISLKQDTTTQTTGK